MLSRRRPANPWPRGARTLNTLEIVRLYAGSLAQGAWVTIELTGLATLVALAIGLAGAIVRTYAGRAAQAAVSVYVEVIRGTPQILQLFIIYFGLSQFRVDLSSFDAALIWLAVYGGAYSIEIFRAGLQSVHAGQHEAATAIGLSWAASMRRVVVPQAIAVMLPALTSFLVLQLKASSLVYTVGAADIMFQVHLAVNTTVQAGVLYMMAAVVYIILNYPLSRLGARIERRVSAYR